MRRAVEHYILKKQLEILDKVKEIYNADDGRTDDEKKEYANEIMSKRMEELQEMVDSENTKTGVMAQIADEFWQKNNTEPERDGIRLRKVTETDRDKFIELELENSVSPNLYQDESFRDSMWEGHIVDTSIVFTIEKDGEYADYCAIKDIDKSEWEISI